LLKIVGQGKKVSPSAPYTTDRSNRYGDIAIFVIFQDGGRRHFGFSKIVNFNDKSAVRGQYASLYHILSKSVKRLQRHSDLTVFFQNGGRPPSWICWAPIGTTHDEFLMVFIVVQNLVNRCISFDNMKLSTFCPFGLKTFIHAPKIWVLGVFYPQNWKQCQQNPQKAHPCANPRRLSHQA